jgi:hypothetical protein
MSGASFSATVDAWTKKSKRRMRVVFQQSVQDVIEIMQTPVGSGGNMPVDTGFLRASLRANIGAAPTGYITKTKYEAGAYQLDSAQYTLTITKANIGDTIYAVYLANYAWFQEYGSQGRDGRAFVRLAAIQWQMIVRENIRKARAIK